MHYDYQTGSKADSAPTTLTLTIAYDGKESEKEKTQIISVMKEVPFSTEPMDNQRIIKEYYEQILYSQI